MQGVWQHREVASTPCFGTTGGGIQLEAGYSTQSLQTPLHAGDPENPAGGDPPLLAGYDRRSTSLETWIPIMSKIHPFTAIRPQPNHAAEVSCPPYDVISTEEARIRASGTQRSFVRVIRSEVEFPKETDPYSAEVYDKALQILDDLFLLVLCLSFILSAAL